MGKYMTAIALKEKNEEMKAFITTKRNLFDRSPETLDNLKQILQIKTKHTNVTLEKLRVTKQTNKIKTKIKIGTWDITSVKGKKEDGDLIAFQFYFVYSHLNRLKSSANINE